MDSGARFRTPVLRRVGRSGPRTRAAGTNVGSCDPARVAVRDPTSPHGGIPSVHQGALHEDHEGIRAPAHDVGKPLRIKEILIRHGPCESAHVTRSEQAQ